MNLAGVGNHVTGSKQRRTKSREPHCIPSFRTARPWPAEVGTMTTLEFAGYVAESSVLMLPLSLTTLTATLVVVAAVVAVVVLIAALFCGWVLTLVGLPGNWLMVAAVAIYAAVIPAHLAVAIGWGVVATVAALAALGEIGESVAGAAGTLSAGGSRRAAIAALVGSIVGGLLGALLGMPLLPLGSLLAAVLLSGCGALIGAVLAEMSLGTDPGSSLRIGGAAMLARLVGTAGKMLVASMIVAVTLASLCF